MAATPAVGQPVVAFQQPEAEYRADDAVSQSELKAILRSPAHHQAEYGPDAERDGPTPSMLFGSGLHNAALEPESFSRNWCSREDYQGEPTVAELQELLAAKGIEFKKSAKKAELLDLAFPEGRPIDERYPFAASDWRNLNGVANALRTHDIAGHWFDPGQKNFRRFNEVSIYAKHPILGVTVKGRLDRAMLSDEKVLVLDLKTTDDARPSAFQRKMVSLSYDLQAFTYSWLAEQAWGLPVEFVFVVVERERPHGISLLRAGDDVIASGREKFDRALNLYAACRSINHWHSYPPEVLSLSMPAWGTMPQEDQCSLI